MHNGQLYIALPVFLLLMVPVCSYSDPYEQDEWAYVSMPEETYYYSDDSSSTIETYNPPREHRSAQRSHESQQFIDTDSTEDRPRRTTSSPPRHTKPSVFTRLPEQISPPGERLIIINPHAHAWGAYSPNGSLVRQGLATSGGNWCDDIDRPCRTRVGSFRITSLGDEDCVSTIYPVGEGGAPMPYCMFFNGGQALHGSNGVVDGNVSHGCVRMRVRDAEWLRYNFADVGTRVVVQPY